MYGIPIQTEIEGLSHAFPTPEQILALGEDVTDCFGALGVISARSNTIYELARALVQGELHLDISVHPEEEMKKLMNIRGIGSWTAKYIAAGYGMAVLSLKQMRA